MGGGSKKPDTVRVAAVVPARCGSKGVPMKNIRPVNGRPLISYCIEALYRAGIESIHVSTECEEIAEVALACGAKVIDRPPETATDQSPTIDCVRHAIETLGLSYEDLVVTAQPTSPLVLPEDVKALLETLRSFRAAISVTECHPILWRPGASGLEAFGHDPLRRARRQDSPRTFEENGALYGARAGDILKYNAVYGEGRGLGMVAIPKTRSFQVDDKEDLKIIEALMNAGVTTSGSPRP